MDLEKKLSDLSLKSCKDSISVKSLVFKPKVNKSQEATAVVVVALESTVTPGSVVGSVCGAKEARLARDELFISHFAVNSAKSFKLDDLKSAKGPFKVVIDRALVALDASRVLAVVGGVFLKQETVVSYLKQFDTVEVDFNAEANKAVTKGACPSRGSTANASEGISNIATTGSSGEAKLIGITVEKSADFSGWYQQVLTKGEMIDYYDISGCYILRPAAYSIWEIIQKWFDSEIKAIGVQNVSFPMFISSRVLEREKDHIEGFAPEVAWVTKAGSSNLEEPIAIRPTSETIFYPYYAKWVQSYRDLPIKLNQWNSVIRWEFKHPQPFLRSREFLWQEGHTAHLSLNDAEDEVLHILDLYSRVYHELLAVPVIKGKKSDKEKFAGASYTTTVEGYIAETGRGIQGATSHHLGQNFSKMFNICTENPLGPDHPKLYAYQNSWGLSTRVIGVMVMTHSDNKGLVIPPRVAQYQAVVIPVGITTRTTQQARAEIHEAARQIESRLISAGVRVIGDYNDNYTPGWKFAQYELKGVPLRFECGPKDIEKGQVTVVRRNDGQKIHISLNDLETRVPQILEDMHHDLLRAATEKFDSRRVVVEDWEDFIPVLNSKNIILAPWCTETECEEDIKESSARKDDGDVIEVDERAPSMGAKTLCIPFDQPDMKCGQKCIKCERPAVNYCLFGRSY